MRRVLVSGQNFALTEGLSMGVEYGAQAPLQLTSCVADLSHSEGEPVCLPRRSSRPSLSANELVPWAAILEGRTPPYII